MTLRPWLFVTVTIKFNNTKPARYKSKYSSAYTAYCSAFQYKTENVISYQHIDGLYDVDEDLILLVFDSF